MKRFFVFLLLLIGIVAPASASDRVVLATFDWEPYVSESLHDNGYVAVIIREAFARSEIEAEFQFNRLKRTEGASQPVAPVQTVQQDNEEVVDEIDGYFPEFYSEEVKSFAAFSEPIPAGPIGFFKLKENDIHYSRLEDLIGYRVGVVKGRQYTQEFDTAVLLVRDYAETDLANFKKLVAGRIDLLVADKFVGLQLIRSHMPEMKNEFEFLEVPLERRDLYLCISSKYLHGGALLKAFDEGLNQMREDGTLERILREHGF